MVKPFVEKEKEYRTFLQTVGLLRGKFLRERNDHLNFCVVDIQKKANQFANSLKIDQQSSHFKNGAAPNHGFLFI